MFANPDPILADLDRVGDPRSGAQEPGRLATDNDANLQKLGSFQRTDTQPGKVAPQGGKYADNLTRVLQQIRMPPGFKIELFALVPDARQMAVSRNKASVWVGTRNSTVWSVTDRDMDNAADTVDEFSPSVKFDVPAGACYSAAAHDGASEPRAR